MRLVAIQMTPLSRRVITGDNRRLHSEPNSEADFERITGNREINKKTTPTSGSPDDRSRATSFGSVSLLIPQDQAADAWGCRSLAPMMMSHSMMASSPNITGKTQLETLCSYCGHNMPVTFVAR